MHIHKLTQAARSYLLITALCLPLAAQSSIKTVKVLGGKDAVELQVEASDRIVPQTKVLASPDRLVIDFPNAAPSSTLRSQSVDLGEVKDVRVGLFQSKPPITRIVLDLKTAQSFQVFPNGRTVIIKISGNNAADTTAQIRDYQPQPTRPGLVITNYTTRVEPVRLDAKQLDTKPLSVTFHDGQLTIHANKATLSEVLYAVQQRTGAEVSIAAGAEQEKVVADIGPAPAPEVLAQLLNGSKFNFLILNAANDPRQLDKVILTPRPERILSQPPIASQNDDDDTPGPAVPPVRVQPAKVMQPLYQPAPGTPPAPQQVAPPPIQPIPMQPETKPITDENNTPD